MKSLTTLIVAGIAFMACTCFAQPIPSENAFVLTAFRPGGDAASGQGNRYISYQHYQELKNMGFNVVLDYYIPNNFNEAFNQGLYIFGYPHEGNDLYLPGYSGAYDIHHYGLNTEWGLYYAQKEEVEGFPMFSNAGCIGQPYDDPQLNYEPVRLYLAGTPIQQPLINDLTTYYDQQFENSNYAIRSYGKIVGQSYNPEEDLLSVTVTFSEGSVNWGVNGNVFKVGDFNFPYGQYGLAHDTPSSQAIYFHHTGAPGPDWRTPSLGQFQPDREAAPPERTVTADRRNGQDGQ